MKIVNDTVDLSVEEVIIIKDALTGFSNFLYSHQTNPMRSKQEREHFKARRKQIKKIINKLKE